MFFLLLRLAGHAFRTIQWNLLIKTLSGPVVLSFVETTREVVLFLSCPLLGGLSSFGVSFIGGFTVEEPPLDLPVGWLAELVR